MAKEVIELYTKEQMIAYGNKVTYHEGGELPSLPAPAYTLSKGDAEEVLGGILKRRMIVHLDLSAEVFLSVVKEAMHTYHLQASVGKQWPSDEDIENYISSRPKDEEAIISNVIYWLKSHQQKPSNNK